MSKFLALIPAAGSGSRMGNELPKQYLSLNSRPMIYHAINTLYQNHWISHIFVILTPSDDDGSNIIGQSFQKNSLYLTVAEPLEQKVY